jgi:hypothetical protein
MFRNEIIWRRTRAHNDRKITRYGSVHDTILYYSRSAARTFNVAFTSRDPDRAIEEYHPIEIERQLGGTAVDKDYVKEFARTFPDIFEKKLRELVRAIEELVPTDQLDSNEDQGVEAAS